MAVKTVVLHPTHPQNPQCTPYIRASLFRSYPCYFASLLPLFVCFVPKTDIFEEKCSRILEVNETRILASLVSLFVRFARTLVCSFRSKITKIKKNARII